ncbi:MAG: ACT domain-containing protein [Xanthomonadales bacterium]|nr:ACT domain-containing protein [Xanthomonadales bacterium]
MHHRLSLRLRPAEGAVLRVLGSIERRGFAIEGIESRRENGWIGLAVALSGERSVEVLARQLARLYDVLAVEIEAAPDAYTAACLQQSFGEPAAVRP